MKSFQSILNTAVNVAVLAFLAFAAFGPDGLVRGILAEQRTERELEAAIVAAFKEVGATPSDGPVVLEFTDYQCPFCRRMAPVLAEAHESGRLRVVSLHHPLSAIHPRAEPAARAAICSAAQGRGEAMHAMLLREDEWYEAGSHVWRELAVRAGVPDPGAFETCFAGPTAVEVLARHARLAEALGVRSTPTYVGRDGVHRGVASVDDLMALAGR